MATVIVAVGSLLVVVALLMTIGLVTGRALLVLVGNEDRPLTTATRVGIAAVVLWSCLISLVVAPGSWAGVALVTIGIAGLVAAASRRPTPLAPEASAWLPFGGAVAAGVVAIAPLMVVAQGRSTALVHRKASAAGRPGWRATGVAAVVGTSSLALGSVLDQHSPAVLAGPVELGGGWRPRQSRPDQPVRLQQRGVPDRRPRQPDPDGRGAGPSPRRSPGRLE